MGFWDWLIKPKAKQGECVPRAFFNATAWAIAHKVPVWIADFKGHWEACAMVDGEIQYLAGNGWDVWPGKKEGDHPIYKMRTLEDAMRHFIKYNPSCMPSAEEQTRLDEMIKRFFGTDPKDVE